MSKNLRGMSARKGLNDSLFSDIVNSTTTFRDNYHCLTKVAQKHLVGRSSVFSAASFYDFLKPEHLDKQIHICKGTACLTSGNSRRMHEALLENYSEEEIGEVSCLGYCHSGNAFLAKDGIGFIPEGLEEGPFIKEDSRYKPGLVTGTNLQKPVFIGEQPDYRTYYQNFQNIGDEAGRALKEIETSGLRGRGGAGFPLHIKLQTSASMISDRKYIICNADEGDPGAFSDKWLLDNRPHTVLAGMLIAGYIVGAREGVIYLRGEYPESLKAVRTAIEEYDKIASGLNLKFKFHLFEGQGAYICGEETALINSLEGLRPEVRTRPPFPATYGLFGKPTILCNVETFANLPYILMEGGRHFSNLGTQLSKGTKLVSLDSAFKFPGIYEIEMGTPMRELLDNMAGGVKYPVKAFQVGGPLGGIVPSERLYELTLDYESFINAGFLLGHAGVVSIPENFPVIKFIHHLFEFVRDESCGKCFPCRLGSARGFEMVTSALEREKRIDKELFYELLETMKHGSLCALGGGISLPVINAVSYFSDELGAWFK